MTKARHSTHLQYLAQPDLVDEDVHDDAELATITSLNRIVVDVLDETLRRFSSAFAPLLDQRPLEDAAVAVETAKDDLVADLSRERVLSGRQVEGRQREEAERTSSCFCASRADLTAFW